MLKELKSGYYEQISPTHGADGGLVFIYDGNNVDQAVEDEDAVVKHCIEWKNESESAVSIAKGSQAIINVAVIDEADHGHPTLSAGGAGQ